MADMIGKKLGPYTITEHLGRGGMADVYKAHHKSLSVDRAIKIIRPEFAATEGFTLRFRKEAQSVAKLRHPNIVQVHDFCIEDNLHYMVMEFIDGKDLKHFIVEDGPLRPIENVVRIISQIADAIGYAHRAGIVHRDVKPQNIIVDKNDNAILTDFGIAKILDSDSQLTRTGVSIGTPAYMAPEQAQGKQEVGPAADIYALAVVLYEALTGRAPYEADTPLATMIKAMNSPVPSPQQEKPDISDSMQQVLMKGLAKDPQDRHRTAQEFREAMQRAVSDQAAEADTELYSPAKTAKQSSGSNSSWLPVAAVLAIVALGAWMLRAYYLPPPTSPTLAEPVADSHQDESAMVPTPTDTIASITGQEPTEVEPDDDVAAVHSATDPVDEAPSATNKQAAQDAPAESDSGVAAAELAAVTEEPVENAERKAPSPDMKYNPEDGNAERAEPELPNDTRRERIAEQAQTEPQPAELYQADDEIVAANPIGEDTAADRQTETTNPPREEGNNEPSRQPVADPSVERATQIASYSPGPDSGAALTDAETPEQAMLAAAFVAPLQLPWREEFGHNHPGEDWEILAESHRVSMRDSQLLLSPSEQNTTLLLRAAVEGDFVATVKVDAQITQHTWSRLVYVVNDTTRLQVGVWGTCCNHGRWPTFSKTVGRETSNLMYQKDKLGSRKLAAYAMKPQVWHLKLQKSGTAYIGSISVNGRTWQEIGTHTLTAEQGRLGLQSGKERKGIPNVARFDDLKVLPLN